MSNSNEVEINCGVIALRDDGIIHMKIKEDHTVEISDLKDIVKAVERLGNKKRFPNLIEGGSFTNICPEARKYSVTDENNIYTIADAFIAKSLSQKLIANFYLKFDKPKVPTRFFRTEKLALTWLEQFKAQI